jgi:hypothetical protein
MLTEKIKASQVEVGMFLVAFGVPRGQAVTKVATDEGRIYFGETYHSVSPDHEYDRRLPKVFKIINLTNINNGDGFEVNDAHYTGQELEIHNDTPTIHEALARLKELGMLNDKANSLNVYIEEEDALNSISLREQKTGRWLYEFRHEPMR